MLASWLAPPVVWRALRWALLASVASAARWPSAVRGWEMNVLAYDPYVSQERADELGVTLVDDLDEMLGQCDFLTLHCPRTEETFHIMDHEQFAKIKPGLVLVNTARGPLINEEALIPALQDGRIWAAGLDRDRGRATGRGFPTTHHGQCDPHAAHRGQL